MIIVFPIMCLVFGKVTIPRVIKFVYSHSRIMSNPSLGTICEFNKVSSVENIVELDAKSNCNTAAPQFSSEMVDAFLEEHMNDSLNADSEFGVQGT